MTAVSPNEIFLSKLVLKAEFKRFKKVNIAVKKVEMLSMLRKFFVFALVLTFMNSVVSSQIPGNNLPEKSEKGIFSKLRSKRKGSPGSPGSTEKAVKKQANNKKKLKKEYQKTVKQTQKRALDIQTPEVRARMKQHRKDSNGSSKSKRKQMHQNSRKADKKFN